MKDLGSLGLDLGVEGDVSLPQLNIEVKQLHYMDYLKLVPNFISLDISKNSTGWIRYREGVVDQGTFSIKSAEEDEVGRRREFREFLIDIFGDFEYEYIFIEDVIGSVNFKTAKILYQLNAIPDDMVEYGLIKAKNIIREGNTTWKKNLKKASGYKSKIRAESDDKRVTRDCLYLLGYGDGTTDEIAEDIYDAMGLAVGVIYRVFVTGAKKKKKLRKDVSKVYKIEQFDDYDEALTLANDLYREIVHLDLMDAKRDLKYNFRKLIEEQDDDSKIYLITIPTSRIGAVALDKGLDLNIEISYLVIYQKF